jgi:hypothetical protein
VLSKKKKKEKLERELEDAEIGAFKSEIISCDALISHFTSLAPSNKETQEVVARPSEVNDPNQPARSTVLVRKEDRDEVFFVGGGKKSKKSKQQNDKDRPLKLNLEIIDQLSLLGVDIPKTTADLQSSIQQLKDKKAHFAENAAEQTEVNKKNAMEKIRKLKEQLAAEDSEE